jgi:hypothetical protein
MKACEYLDVEESHNIKHKKEKGKFKACIRILGLILNTAMNKT